MNNYSYKYEGDANEDGDRHGSGTLYYESGGHLTVDNWISGKANGAGTLVLADGSALVGTWKDGLKQGDFDITTNVGNRFQIRFENNYATQYRADPNEKWLDHIPPRLGKAIYNTRRVGVFKGIAHCGPYHLVSANDSGLLDRLNKENKEYPIEFCSLDVSKYNALEKFIADHKEAQRVKPRKILAVLCYAPEHVFLMIINPIRKAVYVFDNRGLSSEEQSKIRDTVKTYYRNAFYIAPYSTTEGTTLFATLRNGSCANNADATIVLFARHFTRAIDSNNDSVITEKHVDRACKMAISKIRKTTMTRENVSDIMWFMPELKIVDKKTGARQGHNITPIGWPVYPNWPEGHAKPNDPKIKRKAHDDDFVRTDAMHKLRQQKAKEPQTADDLATTNKEKRQNLWAKRSKERGATRGQAQQCVFI